MSKAELMTLLVGQRELMKSRFGVKSLSIFGSAARDAMSDTSDVKFFLEDLNERRVDLVTKGGLRSELRARVELEAVNVA